VAQPAPAKLVVAHRGASGYAPEHSQQAYEIALSQRADVLELVAIDHESSQVGKHGELSSITETVTTEIKMEYVASNAHISVLKTA